MNLDLCEIYKCDQSPISKHGIDVPQWMDSHISAYDITSICQGGCASGAYMPAVTYHAALATMGSHGDDIFDYLQDSHGSLPTLPEDIVSWSAMACFYVSCAVETWCAQFDGQFSHNEPCAPDCHQQ